MKPVHDFDSIPDGEYFLSVELTHGKLTLATPVFQKVEGKTEYVGKFRAYFTDALQGLHKETIFMPDIYLI